MKLKQTKTTTPAVPAALSTCGKDLTGRVVIVKGFADPCGLFKCLGGFGCEPDKAGNAVFGTWLSDGSSDRIERYQCVRFATDEEIKAAGVFAALPAATRLMTQLRSHAAQVERRFAEAQTGNAVTKDTLKDILFLIRREHSRLWEMWNWPDGGLWNDDGTPQGPTSLTRYCDQHGEAWDKSNKRRQ